MDPLTERDIETNLAPPYTDITDPQTLNRYTNVRDNPLRYIDPDVPEVKYVNWVVPLTDERVLQTPAKIDETEFNQRLQRRVTVSRVAGVRRRNSCGSTSFRECVAVSLGWRHIA